MKLVGLRIEKPCEIGGIGFLSEEDLVEGCDITGLNFGELDGRVLFRDCLFYNCTFEFPFEEFQGDLKNEKPMPIIKSCIFRNCHIRSMCFIGCKKMEG